MTKYKCLDHPEVGDLSCDNCYLEAQANRITTQCDAIEFAQNWQSWSSEQSLSYGELAHYQGFIAELGEKYELTEEFKENGLI